MSANHQSSLARGGMEATQRVFNGESPDMVKLVGNIINNMRLWCLARVEGIGRM
ncbi:hypothetical protein ACP4OV_020847 [Aristida adscensionis]